MGRRSCNAPTAYGIRRNLDPEGTCAAHSTMPHFYLISVTALYGNSTTQRETVLCICTTVQ